LTAANPNKRTQYLNAQNTLAELLEMKVIPIVNENDTIAVTEIKFGDNDTLSAITAAMVHADYLFLMTDVDCLYDKNPRTHPDAKAIEVVEDISMLEADGIYPSFSPFSILKLTN
jgi:glutamate 5-kinase